MHYKTVYFNSKNYIVCDYISIKLLKHNLEWNISKLKPTLYKSIIYQPTGIYLRYSRLVQILKIN